MRWYINHKLRLIEEDNRPLNDHCDTDRYDFAQPSDAPDPPYPEDDYSSQAYLNNQYGGPPPQSLMYLAQEKRPPRKLTPFQRTVRYAAWVAFVGFVAWFLLLRHVG